MERRILIVGSGSCAVDIAEYLLAHNAEVIIAAHESGNTGLENLKSGQAEILPDTHIISCKGVVGDFDVSMGVDGKKTTRSVSNIIIAEEDVRIPNYSDYGLARTSRVVSLSELREGASPDKLISQAGKIVFLTGLTREGNPTITEEIMRACLMLKADFNTATYVLTKNLKVGGNGLEKLYRETKKAGTVYIKFSEEMPDIIQHDDGKIGITFLDEITRAHFRLSPDIVVVDEKIMPSSYLNSLKNILKLDADIGGFVQSDNIHRLTVGTNRKGITVAGPSRAIQSQAQQQIDSANAALTTLELLENGLDTETIKAEISPGKCVRCLTCYRSCPHMAIRVNARLTVVPEACEGCGICTAECPKGAITIEGLESSEILGAQEIKDVDNLKEDALTLIAFCCQRSAARAWDVATSTSQKMPRGLRVVEIPCGGGISLDHVFTAFKSGADGVLVLTCHEDNCYSERGNIYAKKRVENISNMLEQLGFEKERLMIGTLASNMGREFAETTNQFEDIIKRLGPSRIKKP